MFLAMGRGGTERGRAEAVMSRVWRCWRDSEGRIRVDRGEPD